ncbi:MAG: hypothetical protein LBT85_01995 [Bifidobacteriaceae bacterium]|jgi:hypothetical protein|nr:hypothetical protein [Bifidobacteriaceae bacterium]
MTYKIVCEAWTENARREISGIIKSNGEIDVFFSSYGEDFEKGMLRRRTSSYSEIINFYEEMIDKILQSGEIVFSELKNQNPKSELINLNTNFSAGMFLAITDLDNSIKNNSIKCFLQTENGIWFKVISKNDNKQYLLESSLEELKLVLISAVYGGRFFDAV